MTIGTPRELLERHYEIFLIAIILFAVGFVIGTLPSYQQAIITEAQKQHIDPSAILTNFNSILKGNAEIALIAYIGWFLIPLFGIWSLPPVLMVFNIGLTFGAVISYASYDSVFILGAFAILETLAFLFAVTGSLLLPKYVILKILRESVNAKDIIEDAIMFGVYSLGFLVLAGGLEALFINSSSALLATIIGAVVTVVVLFVVVSVKD